MKSTRTKLPQGVTRIRNAATGEIKPNISSLEESCEEYMWRMIQLKKQDPDAYNAILKSEALHVLVQ
jgi:hypothetical protein